MNPEHLSYQTLGYELRTRWRVAKENPTVENIKTYQNFQAEAVRRLDVQAEALGLKVEGVSNL